MGSHFDIWDGNLRTIFILSIKKKKKQNHTELCVCVLTLKQHKENQNFKWSVLWCSFSPVLSHHTQNP